MIAVRPCVYDIKVYLPRLGGLFMRDGACDVFLLRSHAKKKPKTPVGKSYSTLRWLFKLSRITRNELIISAGSRLPRTAFNEGNRGNFATRRSGNAMSQGCDTGGWECKINSLANGNKAWSDKSMLKAQL